jgi:HEPN domain-containing protein
MREEVTSWFKQAEADLKSAQNSKKSYDFYMSVFASQQAVEKALKALCLYKLREFPKGHSIIYLAQKADVPEYMLSGIRDLNPEYLSIRHILIWQRVFPLSYMMRVSQPATLRLLNR